MRQKQRKGKKAGSRRESNLGPATEPRQSDNHQPSQSSICTAQVVLNAPVAHLAATQYVPSEFRK